MFLEVGPGHTLSTLIRQRLRESNGGGITVLSSLRHAREEASDGETVAAALGRAGLAGVARVNAAALAHLANAPSAPGETRIIAARLTNDTTLRWDSSPEPDVAGYEIMIRDTSAPRWRTLVDVGDVNEATVAYSKDNWFFGVRAYDGDGYRSPVAYPRAARE